MDHNVHNLTKAHSIKSKPALHSQVPVYIQRNIHTYEASDPNGMNHDDHNFTKGIYTQIRYKHRPSLQHWCIQRNANTYAAPDPTVCGPPTINLARYAHVIATASAFQDINTIRNAVTCTHVHRSQGHNSRCLVKAEENLFEYKQRALLETIGVQRVNVFL